MNRITFLFALALAGCGNDVHSTADAQRAYLGLDPSVDKAIQLGFDGFNAAQSANISAQTAMGEKTGTLTVTGQVDQGASSNKTMRLSEAMTNYSDDGAITYVTDANALPSLTLKLSNIPNGSLSGTLDGSLTMSGGESGTVTLALTLSSMLQPVPTDMTKVQRVPGTTHITGTATSTAGTYTVDVTR
jgi:hypothetical protein